MKIFNKIILTVFLCSCIMAMPVVQKAEGQVPPAERHMQKRIQEIYSQLNLTEDQKKQLETNKQNQQGQRKLLFEQMKTQHDAMHQELMNPNLDMNKINSIQSQIKSLQAQMADNRLNSILEVRRILTSDQFNKFISLMEQHKPKGKQRGHKDEVPD